MSYSESSFCAKSHTGGFWGALRPPNIVQRVHAVDPRVGVARVRTSLQRREMR